MISLPLFFLFLLSIVYPLYVKFVGNVLFGLSLGLNFYPAMRAPLAVRTKSLSVSSPYVVSKLSSVVLSQ